MTCDRQTTVDKQPSGQWQGRVSTARRSRRTCCMEAWWTTRVSRSMMLPFCDGWMSPPRLMEGKKPKQVFYFQMMQSFPCNKWLLPRVPKHECWNGLGCGTLERSSEAEVGWVGRPIYGGVHWEDWGLAQSCLTTGEQAVPHLHWKVGIFPVIFSQTAFQHSGESTARRAALGSSEADFWDQVADGALMAKVCFCLALLHSTYGHKKFQYYS